MKNLHLSDPHYASNITDPELKDVLLAQIPLSEKLDRIVNQEDLSTVDFVIVTGDLVHEGELSDYINVKKLLEEKFEDLPIYYTLGNHDKKELFYSGIQQESKKGNYDDDFIINGMHIIILDSSKAQSHKGLFTDEQLDKLKDTLALNDLPKMLFMHHPIFGGEYFSGFTMEEGDSVLKILKGHPILGVFTGHTHSPAINVSQGILQYTNYALSFGLEKLADGTQLFTNTCGYTMIEYSAEGELTLAPRVISPVYEVYKVTDPAEMTLLNQSYEQ